MLHGSLVYVASLVIKSNRASFLFISYYLVLVFKILLVFAVQKFKISNELSESLYDM